MTVDLCEVIVAEEEDPIDEPPVEMYTGWLTVAFGVVGLMAVGYWYSTKK